jgi:hypothetical protein
MKKRYFLVAYTTGHDWGSIWFDHDGFPTHAWIKKAIVDKFKMINTTPSITNVYEFKSEGDYYEFCSNSTL